MSALQDTPRQAVIMDALDARLASGTFLTSLKTGFLKPCCKVKRTCEKMI